MPISRRRRPTRKIVKRLPQGLIDSARFAKIMQVEPGPDSETILTLAEPGAPLLLSRNVGSGSVLMFTTSADRTWNELAIHPLYAMLMQQAATNLTSRPDARQIIVGESADVPLPGRQVGDDMKLTDPAGEITDVKVTQSGERVVCAIDTEQAGVYQIAADAAEPGIALAANVDPAESNVRVIDPGALSSQLKPFRVEVVAETSALAKAIDNSRRGRELSWLLLMLGIGAFLLQSLLAKYFTDRMSRGESDVSASLQMARVAAARRS